MNKINIQNILMTFPIILLLILGGAKIVNFPTFELILNRYEIIYKLSILIIFLIILILNVVFVLKKMNNIIWIKILIMLPILYLFIILLFFPEIRMFVGSKLQILIFTIVGTISFSSGIISTRSYLKIENKKIG